MVVMSSLLIIGAWWIVLILPSSYGAENSCQGNSSCSALVPYDNRSQVLLAPLMRTEVTYDFSEDLSTETKRMDHTIILKQKWGAGGSGTGSAAWAAADVLASLLAKGVQWLLQTLAVLEGKLQQGCSIEHRKQWRGVTAVELGSGLGLVSITAARLGMSVLATDGDPPTLPLLEENLIFNRVQDVKPSGLTDECAEGSVRARLLQWGKGSQQTGLCGGAKPELVVASDVVYGGNRSVWKAHPLECLILIEIGLK